MKLTYSRRQMLKWTGQVAATAALSPALCLSAGRSERIAGDHGAIIGETAGAEAGSKILAEGGNAIDAIVCAALVSCVATPARCGLGGYGGHATIALAKTRKITCIDFNSVAPAAARPDMYPLDESGKVLNDANFHGWRAVGVPGTLAGLQLALERYGTRSFRETAAPAIELARRGVPIIPNFSNAIRGAAGRFRKDPGSAKIYLRDGQPLAAGETLNNPELAELLSTLAERNSVETFYRGDIAQRFSEAFKKNGGLVTVKDLAGYHAREVPPLKLDWNGYSLFTAPLTAGGLTFFEAFTILKELRWKARSHDGPSAHAHLEAIRLAWKDRLELLGDPEKVQVPAEKLVSRSYAREQGKKIEFALRQKHPVPIQIAKHLDEGTVNLSCVDAEGNMVAMTLTQGGGFGAQVTAEGLGIMLGHGMSRFNPHPDHPNCPAPGKRPLHNMCPSVVVRDGRPVLAVGAAGGLRIPNALYQVLTHFVAGEKAMQEAVAAPRFHTTGTLEFGAERNYEKGITDYLGEIGFEVKVSPTAMVSAVYYDARRGVSQAAFR